MKVLIREILVNNIFGQYVGTYLDNEIKTVKFSNGEGSDRNFTLILSQENNRLTLDFLRLKDKPSLGQVISFDNYVLTNYAKNPANGIIAVITGAYKVVV